MWSGLSSLTHQLFGFRQGLLKAGRSQKALDAIRALSFGLGADHDDRVRAAVLVGSRGRTEDFDDLCELARLDSRDVLVDAGFADDSEQWRLRVEAILRWRGHATTFANAPADSFGKAALALTKAWIGPSWRTDPALRPVLDHLARTYWSREDPPRAIAEWFGDASIESSELLDHGRIDADASRWGLVGHDPSQLTRLLDDAARVVYVNSYAAWSQPRALEALGNLERVTMWRGWRVAPFHPSREPLANRFDLDIELQGVLGR